MRWLRWCNLVFAAAWIAAAAGEAVETTAPAAWPPDIPGADANGVITLGGEGFLQVPEPLERARKSLDGFAFDVARAAPTVELVFHDQLPHPGVSQENSTGWTAWGDIAVAADGSVYVGIGDHGRDVPADSKSANANVLLYRWDPARRDLERIAEPNAIVRAAGDGPRWSKIHAGIHQARDGKIYFTPTLNDGQRATEAPWTANVPAGQIFQYDPKTGQTKVIGRLPDRSATATTELDADRNILYCNLEGIHRNALFAFDLAAMQPVFQGPDGMIGPNRNMAMARDGSIYYNAPDGRIGRYDPEARQLAVTPLIIPGGRALRSSTRQARDGWIYGTTYTGEAPQQLLRFDPGQAKLELLGADFCSIDPSTGAASLGSYTTVCVLSPDERFVYYLPGAHGEGVHIFCPVVQYEIATGRRKILAFLRPVLEQQAGYTPGGTYGVAISADGATLYVNLNGHATEPTQLAPMRPTGFGLTAFAAVHIPHSER